MWWTRSEEAAAEARKAEGASCTALRIPSPPIFTGRVACAHAGSSSEVYICDTAHDRLEKLVIFLQHGREKAGRGPEVVEEYIVIIIIYFNHLLRTTSDSRKKYYP